MTREKLESLIEGYGGLVATSKEIVAHDCDDKIRLLTNDCIIRSSAYVLALQRELARRDSRT